MKNRPSLSGKAISTDECRWIKGRLTSHDYH
jgi:hypothetical protein